MQLINLSNLIVPENRQRKDFPQTHIEQLAKSILDHGLFHPILLEDDELTLRAGDCRRQAVALLYSQDKQFSHDGRLVEKYCIPYTRLGSLTPIQRFEVELEENIRRRDLSVTERASAIARLHELKRESQEGLWTNKDTAETLQSLEGGNLKVLEAEVADSLIIEAMADDPDVQHAAKTSRSRAAHIARRKIESELSSALASTLPSNPGFTLHKRDAFELLPVLPRGTFDGIIADPPYGVDAEGFGDLTKKHNYADDLEHAQRWVNLIGREGLELTRPQAHLYMFCDIILFPRWAQVLSELGWWVWRTPLIWHKPNSKRVPQLEFGPGRSYEAILYAIKGNKPLRLQGRTDVLSYSLDHEVHRHPAGKPEELYTDILNRSFSPGDKVLDPAVGGGTIYEAAKPLQIQIEGSENDEEWFSFARSKVTEI